MKFLAGSRIRVLLASNRVALWALFLGFGFQSSGATLSPLFARGYTVIPTPQRVTLESQDFQFGADWRLDLGPSVQPEEISVQSLNEQLRQRFHLKMQGPSAKAGVIRLAISAGQVRAGAASDSDKAAIAQQAYRINLSPTDISITGNTATGLFYGVQTLIQLLKPDSGRLWLPEGEIEDWPDLQLRVIYWDDAHHLEHPNVLKAALREASFFKINAFSIKLEGHFQYVHAQPLVEPYALTPAELQDLTDYGLKYHVQVIPYLDGPAHDAFILKHPEYKALREYPDSNYEFCVTNPKTYDLFKGMFDDLLAANKGSKYFVLSTDEPYYVGLADNQQCNEVQRAKQLGSVGKLLAEFVTRTADYLHSQGRTVIFWGEYPMKPEDIQSLPNHLVNGEVYGPEFDPEFKVHGIRQLLFTSTVGRKEYLFPNYYLLPDAKHLPGPSGGTYEPVKQGPGAVQDMFDYISYNPARKQADLMGSFVAGWADVGLNPETMWLGYATGSAAAWHFGSPDPPESMNAFYRLFYGPNASNMGRLYQLMCEQAQFWKESWDVKASSARTPLWGDWNIIYQTPQPAQDQSLPLMPTPRLPLLSINYDWDIQNASRLKVAREFLADNDELFDLLDANTLLVDFHRYNLQVYLSIATLFRQNIEMLRDMHEINIQLKKAQTDASHAKQKEALADLDEALNIAKRIRIHRNEALQKATNVWYQQWYPRVSEANGRRFLDKVDDAKDHLPVRTIDMSYLIYRELLYPFDEWAKQTVAARNEYAQAHNLPVRSFSLEWTNTETEVAP